MVFDKLAAPDLARRVWNCRSAGVRLLHKVRAHRDPATIDDDLECYHALGNQYADRIATQASDHMYPEMAKLWHSAATELTEETTQLENLYRMYLKIFAERAKQQQLDALQEGHGLEASSADTQLNLLCNWQVTTSWHPPESVLDRTAHSSYGPTLSRCFMSWVSKIVWQDPFEGISDDPGITFQELAVSFMVDQQTYIPLQRPQADGSMFLMLPADSTEATAASFKLADLGLAMSQWIAQMVSLHVPELYPVQQHVHCKGLYRLGARVQAFGFGRRPVHPQQTLVIQKLAALARSFGEHMGKHGIDISVGIDVPAIRGELKLIGGGRYRKVDKYKAEVRRFKQALAGA